MLAIQYIKMYWTKENRTPEGSLMRKNYYKPDKIDSSVNLDGLDAEIFVQKRHYTQKDIMYTDTEYNKKFGNYFVNASGPTESAERERKRKYLLEQNVAEKDNRGKFYDSVESVKIPGIEIIKEDDAYRIIWYSLDRGYQPVRKGYNQFYHKNGKRIKHETAFVLKKGEAGKIEYNYRYTSYYGQHYEQFCIYIINTDEINHNTFVDAKYEKQYNELVDLF